MKYLQTFESSNKNDYYKEVDQRGYDDEFNYLTIFSTSDYDRISNRVSDNNLYLYSYKTEVVVNHSTCLYRYRSVVVGGLDGYRNVAQQVVISGPDETFIISKKEDEWFLVEIALNSSLIYSNRKGIGYYICDQMEGLLKLLDDKL